MNGLSARPPIENLFTTMYAALAEEENSSALCNENEEVKSIVQLLKKLKPTTSNLVEELDSIKERIKKLGESSNRGLMMISARLQRIVQPVMQELSPPPPPKPVVVQRAPDRVNRKATISKAPPQTNPSKAVPLQVRPTLTLNLSRPAIVRPPLQEEGKRCPPKINFDHMCFANSPLQGLMYSPYFNQFLTIKEKERVQDIAIEKIDCFLDWFLAIKKEWNSGDNVKLNSTLSAFKSWIQKEYKQQFSLGKGDSYEFLQVLLEQTHLDSKAFSQPETPWSMTVSLASAFEEGVTLSLQEMAQKDFNRMLKENSQESEDHKKDYVKDFSMPDILFLHYPLDYQTGRVNELREFSTKAELVFPQDNVLIIKEQKYQLTSFTCAADIGHYFQCLYLDGRWIKCNDDKIEVMIAAELQKHKQKPYVLFFEKIKQDKEKSA